MAAISRHAHFYVGVSAETWIVGNDTGEPTSDRLFCHLLGGHPRNLNIGRVPLWVKAIRIFRTWFFTAGDDDVTPQAIAHLAKSFDNDGVRPVAGLALQDHCETKRIRPKQGVIQGIRIKIDAVSEYSQWVFGNEAPQPRMVVARPRVVEAGALILPVGLAFL